MPYLIFVHYRETREILASVSDDKLVWSVIEKTGPAIHALTELEGATYVSLTDTLCYARGIRPYFDDVLDVTSLDGGDLTPQASVFAMRQLADSLAP